jgi:hypothetical protein
VPQALFPDPGPTIPIPTFEEPGGFAADELALELHMSQGSAAGQMDYATTVAARLPGPSPRCAPATAVHAGTVSHILQIPVPSSEIYRGGFGFNGGSGQL